VLIAAVVLVVLAGITVAGRYNLDFQSPAVSVTLTEGDER
jgi:hypothetical protein